MTTSAQYNANCNTQITAQDNLMDDLMSSCAIMTKVIVVLVSVGGVYFWALQPHCNSCTWPSVCFFL